MPCAETIDSTKRRQRKSATHRMNKYRKKIFGLVRQLGHKLLDGATDSTIDELAESLTAIGDFENVLNRASTDIQCLARAYHQLKYPPSLTERGLKRDAGHGHGCLYDARLDALTVHAMSHHTRCCCDRKCDYTVQRRCEYCQMCFRCAHGHTWVALP